MHTFFPPLVLGPPHHCLTSAWKKRLHHILLQALVLLTPRPSWTVWFC